MYSAEVKSAALALALTGTSIRRVSEKTHVSERTIRNWVADLPKFPGVDKMVDYLYESFAFQGGITRDQMRAGTLVERFLKHEGSDYPNTDALDELVGE